MSDLLDVTEPGTYEAAVIANLPELSPSRMKTLFAQPPKSLTKWAVYEYAVKGLSPLLCDRTTDLQIQGLNTGEKVDYGKDEPFVVKAARKLYGLNYNAAELPVGQIVVPNENFLACLRDTGKQVKWGQGRFETITGATAGTKLFCLIRLVEPAIIIRDLDGNPIPVEYDGDQLSPNQRFKVDVRKGNATQGTGAVGIIRPRLNEWAFAGRMFVAVIGEYTLSEQRLAQLINKAGLAAGLCSGRPANMMPFGQFVLTHLQWVGGEEPRKTVVSTGDGTEKPAPKKRASRKRTAADAPPPAEEVPAPPESEVLPAEAEAPLIEPSENGDGQVE